MRVAVVGGGIAGMAAAWQAVTDGHEVVLVEASDRLGGKIRTSAFGGLPVDEGPDAFLTRVPDATALCAEIGLDDLVPPATGKAYLWARGALRPIPEATVLGIPTDLSTVAPTGLLTEAGLSRAAMEPTLAGPAMTDDTSIGELVRRRFGDEVADYLVDPLLGGINAGGIDNLSVEVAAAQVAAVARRSESLMVGLAAMRAAAPPSGASVFLAPRGGMQELVDRLAGALTEAGAQLRTGVSAERLEPVGGGWTVFVGRGSNVEADRIVVASPAPTTAALLKPHALKAADAIAAIDHASVALVTLLYPKHAIGLEVDGSGFLVPRPEGRMLTACSWFSSKWAHLDLPGHVIMRASVGRFGDAASLTLDDGPLVDQVHAELTEAMGLTARPTEARVSRWFDAFPQFAPGHLNRMAEVDDSIAEDAPGLAVAGSFLRGVGLPACIKGGREAATRLTV
ncbi:MAG: protoporphyrinogen oxidase [Acidimicrobiales bacterium]